MTMTACEHGLAIALDLFRRELELLTKKAGEGEWVQTVVPKIGV